MADELLLHGEVLTDADFSGRRFRYVSIANSAELIRCDFSRTRFDGGGLGGGYDPSTYTDCVFDGAHLKNVLGGRARFVRCSFRDVRIQAFHASETEFVDCVFSGTLKKVIFNGTALDDEKLGRTVNEFHGNDFSAAKLSDVSFRRGIDLDLQRLPADGEHVFVRNAPETVSRARLEVDRWPEASLRDDADTSLLVLENTYSSGQRDLFVDRSLLGRDPETVRRLAELLA